MIQAWLSGEQRDKIAVDNGISAGSVTNIVNEWRAALGFPTADALRELGVTLRKVGISAAECALGSRISTIIKKIGIKEDSFESFILDVYNRCKDIGLSAQNISLYLQDLVEFSRDAIIPLSQISSYIKERTDEKKKLEEEIEEKKIQLETLEKERRHFESCKNKK